MTQKQKQFSEEYAAAFQDPSVVAAYHHRPPYPAQTFDLLAGLMDKGASPQRILDAGCGRGEMASMLRHFADEVDAVDISATMIEAGKQMPYGSDPRINWIIGGIEEAALNPPYALIVAAASIHWMAWETTLPRFATMLSPNGYLALVETVSQPSAWGKEIGPILAHYSMNRDYQPYNMLTIASELERRGLFQQRGVIETDVMPFRQRVDGWIEGFHATNGFSRDRMDTSASAEFDRQLRDTIAKYSAEGEVEQLIGARVVFGKPLGAQG